MTDKPKRPKHWPTYDRLMEAYNELDASHNYWVENYNMKAGQVDDICIKTAEKLGEVDYQLQQLKSRKTGKNQDAVVCELLAKRDMLENVLIHFNGFVNLDFIIEHDRAPGAKKRNKTRKDRLHHNTEERL